MFRFTIRDMMWLTVVVGLALGWSLRERRLLAENDRASKWRMAAGALEDILREDGRTVQWGYRDEEVLLIKRSSRSQLRGAISVHTSRVVTMYEPSADQP